MSEFVNISMSIRILRYFCRWKDGGTSIEYALITSLIAVVIIFSVSVVGETLSEVYQAVVEKIEGNNGNG